MGDDFQAQNERMIADMATADGLAELSRRWFDEASRYEYSYHFEWLGVPVIQFPQDLVAMQEIVWRVKPGLVVETGIARGGSLIFYASLLELLGGDRKVLGIDLDIRSHNRRAIEAHPMMRRIAMLEGSSTDQAIVDQVFAEARGREPVLVCLDSNHTHEHVARELELYAPLVGEGSYLVVFDTCIETMREDAFPDRPWGRGDNPRTAVEEFLARNDRFVVDEAIDAKLQISVAPRGYLRCVRSAK